MTKSLWRLVSGPYTRGALTKQDRHSNLKAMNLAAVEQFKMMPVSLDLAERCDAILLA